MGKDGLDELAEGLGVVSEHACSNMGLGLLGNASTGKLNKFHVDGVHDNKPSLTARRSAQAKGSLIKLEGKATGRVLGAVGRVPRLEGKLYIGERQAIGG